MKLIIAIVNKLDTETVCAALTKAGFFFTQIGSHGGFLREGNSTLMIGTEDRKVEKAKEIFRENCSRRQETVKSFYADGLDSEGNPLPKSVTVGGATIFVLDIEQFEKM